MFIYKHLLLLLLFCSVFGACFRGPVLYPDPFLFEGDVPEVTHAIVTEFKEFIVPKGVATANEKLVFDARVWSKDISLEIANQLSTEGIFAEGSQEATQRENTVLIRGALIKRGRAGGIYTTLFILPMLAASAALAVIARVLPITTRHSYHCSYEYFIEITNAEGKVFLQEKGEIDAEYSSLNPYVEIGGCRTGSKKTFKKIQAMITRDIANYLQPALPSP